MPYYPPGIPQQYGDAVRQRLGRAKPESTALGPTEIEGRAGLEADYRRIGGVNEDIFGRSLADVDRLGAIASGQAEGAGEMASRRQAARDAARQQSIARSATGYGAVGAGRGAARNLATMATDAQGAAATAAAGDQERARQLRAAMLNQLQQGQFRALDPAMQARVQEMQARTSLAQEEIRKPTAGELIVQSLPLIKGIF